MQPQTTINKLSCQKITHKIIFLQIKFLLALGNKFFFSQTGLTFLEMSLKRKIVVTAFSNSKHLNNM